MDSPAGQLEWLETATSGSFALGCVDRRLRRKYHSLLTVREPGRGDAWSALAELREVVLRGPERALLCDPRSGHGEFAELAAFDAFPCATHRYRALGLDVTRSVRLFSSRDGASDQVALHYAIAGVSDANADSHEATPVTLELEPLLRCRGVHDLTFENAQLDGSLTRVDGFLRMCPYEGLPALQLRIEGVSEFEFVPRPHWLTDVYYPWEAERGYPAGEHLFSPGRFVIALERDTELTFVLAVEARDAAYERSGAHVAAPTQASLAPDLRSHTQASVSAVRSDAQPPASTPRLGFAQKLERAAAQFFMQTRAGGTTVVAGFPWFGPWGRDTLIALPGLYLATGDLERAMAVLESMADARINGLVPNIPALGEQPANTCSIDASLLFVRAVQWFAEQVGTAPVERFMPIVCELLEAIADASDPRMHFDHGVGVWMERGPWALTWMDALVDGSPVTPRAGYAIEIDALAYNAAQFATAWSEAHRGLFARAFRTRLRRANSDFIERYWDDTRGYLADGHDGRRPDPSLRPNQLFAIGLPQRAIPDHMGRASLEVVSRELLVPAGLRTLATRDPHYRGTYGGGVVPRDLAYHQGTVWPWLVGIYAESLLRLHGRGALETRLSDTFSFMARHLADEGCVGQLSEVFSGDSPHAPNGTPAQAWSVSEIYRALRMLGERRPPTP
jgi:predicted glycogen debranching enzyme